MEFGIGLLVAHYELIVGRPLGHLGTTEYYKFIQIDGCEIVMKILSPDSVFVMKFT